MKLRYYPFFFFFFLKISVLQAQISSDSIQQLFRQTPAFTMHKDNYFIIGTTPFTRPDEVNSNVKYQISIKQRMANIVFPFKTYWYFTYSQKSIWRIFQYSSPFAESNYNPGMGLGKIAFYKNKQRGLWAIDVEHESNGRGDQGSRSWNKLTLNYKHFFNRKLMINGQVWWAFPDQLDNPDLLDYYGLGEVALHYETLNERFHLDLTMRKGLKLEGHGFCQAQISYRILPKNNQFFTLQWFNGYGETLIVYNSSINMIRVGVIFKPDFFKL